MDLDLSDSIMDKMLQQNNHNNNQNNNINKNNSNNNKISQQKKNKKKAKGIKKPKPKMDTLRQIVQPKRKSKQNIPKEVKPKSLPKGLRKTTVTKTNIPFSAKSNTVSIPVGSSLNVMTTSNGHSSVAEAGYSISIPNQQNSISYTNYVSNTNQGGNTNYHGNSNAQSNTNHPGNNAQGNIVQQGNNNVQSSANQLLGPLLSSVLKVGQNQNGVLPIYSVQTKSVQNVGNRNDLLSRLQNILTMRSSNSGVGHNLVQHINQNLIKASQKPIISIVPFRKKVKGPLGVHV